MPKIKQVKALFSEAMVDAYEFDGTWLRVSEGHFPLAGNRKILVPYMGIVWVASRDPLDGGKYNLLGSGRSRLAQDIELWMPLPDCPDEPQPYDAFTRKPASMYKEESA